MKVVVYTCDRYANVVPGFAYLFNVYWSSLQPVAYAGCRKLNLPGNFQWLRVQSRVKERWSDGFIEMLRMLHDDHVVWLLEDYWLCRGVDHQAVRSLDEYMYMHPDVMRVDLTADRLHSGNAEDVDSWGHLDLIETSWDTPYQFSTQAAIWNRRHLLSMLRPEMSPWDFELQDGRPAGLRVLGTRQWPVRYVNVLGMGLEPNEYRVMHRRQGLGGLTVERIEPEHLAHLREHRLLPRDRRLAEVNR